jgi:hypothetical protein
MLVPFVRLSAHISTAPTGRVSLKFVIVEFHENPPRASKFGSNRTKISDTLHEDLRTFYCCLRCLHTSALWHGIRLLWDYANAPRCYFIRTSPIFLYFLRFLLCRLGKGAIFCSELIKLFKFISIFNLHKWHDVFLTVHHGINLF